jgi:hypothetical protein
MLFHSFEIISPQRCVSLHLTWNPASPKDDLCYVWLKFGQWVKHVNRQIGWQTDGW